MRQKLTSIVWWCGGAWRLPASEPRLTLCSARGFLLCQWARCKCLYWKRLVTGRPWNWSEPWSLCRVVSCKKTDASRCNVLCEASAPWFEYVAGETVKRGSLSKPPDCELIDISLSNAAFHKWDGETDVSCYFKHCVMPYVAVLLEAYTWLHVITDVQSKVLQHTSGKFAGRHWMYFSIKQQLVSLKLFHRNAACITP